MSIDLDIDLVQPVSITPLLPKMAATLAELLGVRVIPRLAMDSLDNGKRLPVVNDIVGIEDGPLLLISISGEPETVGLVGGSDHLAVTMAVRRTNLEYALGAAVAITLAREFGGGVDDDRTFFGDEIHTSPETLFARLRVQEPQPDYRHAAEKITWGPHGGW
ncbi:MAG TPA: hypothetical protein VN654_07455 [Vicinamibacterales bacterium]|jgi:hypothetical protein|nr:hypothetical protein [Vicinamibacterales bacterium]